MPVPRVRYPFEDPLEGQENSNGTECHKSTSHGRSPPGPPDAVSLSLGRRRITSRSEIERIALELFFTKGFDETPIDEIAAKAGVGRRTVFRYFASKNDIVWGDFDRELARFRDRLESGSSGLSLIEAIGRAVVEFNQFPAEVERWHRQRMALILRVPALQAHSTLRYADWKAIVVDFSARRLGLPPDSFVPRLLGELALAAALAAYQQWLHSDGDGEALSESLAMAFKVLAPAYETIEQSI